MKKRKKLASLFAGAMAITMALSACGSSTQTTSGDSAGESDTSSEETTKIGEGRTLVVGVWGAEQEELVREYVVKPFEEETGATVEPVLGGTADRYSKLYAEVDNPSMDVVYLNMAQTQQATKDGVIMPVDPEGVPNYNSLYDIAKIGDGYGVALIACGLMYSTEEFSEAPDSWAVCWDEAYAGRVAPYCFPGSQGSAFLVMAAKTFGGDEYNIDPGFEAIAKLKPYPMIADGIPDLNQAFMDGSVVLAPQISGYVYAAQDEGVPVDFTIPEEGAVLTMNCAVIPKNTENADLAKIFINYHLAQACQEAYADVLYYGPTNADVVLPEELADKVIYGEEDVAGLYTPDNAYLSEHEAEWTERWNTEILG